jgi:adenylate cyclase
MLAETHDDGPSKLYRDRCREYLVAPPPEEWDGVYTAKTK